uniref:Uncharacterized protein n=1 Tax=Oryza meridionalis TaxID=40149 RepID=A0A0E0DT24_9ORYZ
MWDKAPGRYPQRSAGACVTFGVTGQPDRPTNPPASAAPAHADVNGAPTPPPASHQPPNTRELHGATAPPGVRCFACAHNTAGGAAVNRGLALASPRATACQYATPLFLSQWKIFLGKPGRPRGRVGARARKEATRSSLSFPSLPLAQNKNLKTARHQTPPNTKTRHHQSTTTRAVCLASSSLVSLASSADRSFRRAPELPLSHPKRPETEPRGSERERGEGRGGRVLARHRPDLELPDLPQRSKPSKRRRLLLLRPRLLVVGW